MISQTATATEINLAELNDIFKPLSYQQRIARLYEFFPKKDVLVTSSFGTRSVFLLHQLSQVRPDQKIHFIDTTYHFSETLQYKSDLTARFGLQVVDVLPEKKQNELTRDESWWEDHPKMCCTINKIHPLDPIIADHTVWIAGLMAWQTQFRARLDIFEQQGDIIKFHPFIDIDEGEFLYQLSFNKLPRHPLEKHGFGSIGCTHCTKKGQGRSGRWNSSAKTECGIHPNYFIKKKK